MLFDLALGHNIKIVHCPKRFSHRRRRPNLVNADRAASVVVKLRPTVRNRDLLPHFEFGCPEFVINGHLLDGNQRYSMERRI